MIVVIGGTGNVGSKVISNLRDSNTPYLAIQSANGATEGYRKGNLMDLVFLNEVLSEAKTLFSILPGSIYPQWEEYSELLTGVLRDSQVSHIVNISNAVIEKDGQPTILNSFEGKLNSLSNISIKHLRCANFFENLNWGLDNGYKDDLKLPYVSTHEVASVASGYLLSRSFSGHSIDELLGPADYSMNDFCRLTGKDSRQMLLTDESKSFFEPFNHGSFILTPRTENNTTSHPDPRFYLDYFLQNEYRNS